MMKTTGFLAIFLLVFLSSISFGQAVNIPTVVEADTGIFTVVLADSVKNVALQLDSTFNKITFPYQDLSEPDSGIYSIMRTSDGGWIGSRRYGNYLIITTDSTGLAVIGSLYVEGALQTDAGLQFWDTSSDSADSVKGTIFRNVDNIVFFGMGIKAQYGDIDTFNTIYADQPDTANIDSVLFYDSRSLPQVGFWTFDTSGAVIEYPISAKDNLFIQGKTKGGSGSDSYSKLEFLGPVGGVVGGDARSVIFHHQTALSKFFNMTILPVVKLTPGGATGKDIMQDTSYINGPMTFDRVDNFGGTGSYNTGGTRGSGLRDESRMVQDWVSTYGDPTTGYLNIWIPMRLNYGRPTPGLIIRTKPGGVGGLQPRRALDIQGSGVFADTTFINILSLSFPKSASTDTTDTTDALIWADSHLDSTNWTSRPTLAFDNSTGTFWNSDSTAFPHQLVYSFPDCTKITKVGIYKNQGYIKNWKLAVSKDSVTWDTLGSFQQTSGDGWNYYNIDNDSLYQHYMIHVIDNWGFGGPAAFYARIAEVEFYPFVNHDSVYIKYSPDDTTIQFIVNNVVSTIPDTSWILDRILNGTSDSSRASGMADTSKIALTASSADTASFAVTALNPVSGVGMSDDSLALYLSLDDGFIDNVVDTNTGVTTSTANFRSDSFKIGTGGYYFNLTGKLTYADDDDWTFDNFSIGFKANFSTSGLTRTLIRQVEDGTNFWQVVYNGTTQLVEFDALSGGVTQMKFRSSVGVGTVDNQWYDMWVIRDDSTAYIYVDGVSKGLVETKDIGDTTLANLAGALEVRNYNGLLDEVKIYRRALSADEVRSHSNYSDIFNLNITIPSLDSIKSVISDSVGVKSDSSFKSITVDQIAVLEDDSITVNSPIKGTSIKVDTSRSDLTVGNTNLSGNSVYGTVADVAEHSAALHIFKSADEGGSDSTQVWIGNFQQRAGNWGSEGENTTLIVESFSANGNKDEMFGQQIRVQAGAGDSITTLVGLKIKSGTVDRGNNYTYVGTAKGLDIEVAANTNRTIVSQTGLRVQTGSGVAAADTNNVAINAFSPPGSVDGATNIALQLGSGVPSSNDGFGLATGGWRFSARTLAGAMDSLPGHVSASNVDTGLTYFNPDSERVNITGGTDTIYINPYTEVIPDSNNLPGSGFSGHAVNFAPFVEIDSDTIFSGLQVFAQTDCVGTQVFAGFYRLELPDDFRSAIDLTVHFSSDDQSDTYGSFKVFNSVGDSSTLSTAQLPTANNWEYTSHLEPTELTMSAGERMVIRFWFFCTTGNVLKLDEIKFTYNRK